MGEKHPVARGRGVVARNHTTRAIISHKYPIPSGQPPGLFQTALAFSRLVARCHRPLGSLPLSAAGQPAHLSRRAPQLGAVRRARERPPPLECSSIDVPMDQFDAENSGNQTFSIPLIRQRGRDAATKNLLLNPGGPRQLRRLVRPPQGAATARHRGRGLPPAGIRPAGRPRILAPGLVLPRQRRRDPTPTCWSRAGLQAARGQRRHLRLDAGLGARVRRHRGEAWPLRQHAADGRRPEQHPRCRGPGRPPGLLGLHSATAPSWARPTRVCSPRAPRASPSTASPTSTTGTPGSTVSRRSLTRRTSSMVSSTSVLGPVRRIARWRRWWRRRIKALLLLTPRRSCGRRSWRSLLTSGSSRSASTLITRSSGC